MNVSRPAPVDDEVDRPLVGRLHRSVVDDVTAWADLSEPDRRRQLAETARRIAPLLDDRSLCGAVDEVWSLIAGLGPLEPLLADPGVTEIMVNGGGTVFIERHGRIEPTPLVLSEASVLQLIERIVAPLGLRIDRSHPIVDARLADGSRVNAIIRPATVDGPCLTIRRFGVTRVGLDAFTTEAVADLLCRAVAARRNILVSGGTGAGKTTLLNALAGAIPRGERIITIEDTAELRLDAPHVVRLESRPANADGIGALAIHELVRNALRMRPDRLIVGEVRSGEALDMLQAMNTGHDGSLSTCHANGPVDALRRLETMALMAAVDLPLAAIRQQVHAALDVVVHVARAADGRRRVAAVHEVAHHDGRSDQGGPATVELVREGAVVARPQRPPRGSGAAPRSAGGWRP